MSPLHDSVVSVGQVVEQLRFGGFLVERIPNTAPPARGWLASMRRSILRMPLRFWRFATRSHHVFDATAFFLARPRPAEQHSV